MQTETKATHGINHNAAAETRGQGINLARDKVIIYRRRTASDVIEEGGEPLVTLKSKSCPTKKIGGD